jgi:hypothetical protein
MQRKQLNILFLVVMLGLMVTTPAMAVNWGASMASDTIGDGSDQFRDIAEVDAAYEDGFAWFRFTMNSYLNDGVYYEVWIDFDSNRNTGEILHDMGVDLHLSAYHGWFFGPIVLIAELEKWENDTLSWAEQFEAGYNATGDNRTFIYGSPANVDPLWFKMEILNTSRGSIGLALNWTYIIDLMALNEYEADNCTMRLLYVVDSSDDYAPNQGLGESDYYIFDVCIGDQTTLGWILIIAGIAVLLLAIIYVFMGPKEGLLALVPFILIVIGVAVAFGGIWILML